MSKTSRPIRWASLALACLLALPLPWGVFADFYVHLSPFLALQSFLAHMPALLFGLPAAVVLLLIIRWDRWFCRHACPTGALCDAASACRRKRRSWDAFPRVHKALAVAALAAAACGAPALALLDPMALFHGAWAPVHQGPTIAAALGVAGLAAVLLLSFLFPRLWCARLCPLGGLQMLAAGVRRTLTRAPAPMETERAPLRDPALGRRSLFAAAAGVAGGLLLRRAAGGEKPSPLRPPGALPEDRFALTCCRCGTCARVCPTRIVRPALDVRDPIGLLAPELEFSRGYCLPACNACSRACPTGAIAPFEIEAKQRLLIGTARIRVDGCVVVKGRECDRCVVSCEYHAIRITGGLFDPAPEIDAARCVGCGACAVVCPEGVVSIRPVGEFSVRTRS